MDLNNISEISTALEKVRERTQNSGFMGLVGFRTDDIECRVTVNIKKEQGQPEELPLIVINIESRSTEVDDESMFLERIADAAVEEFEAERGSWSSELQEMTKFGGVQLQLNDEVIY